MAGARIARRLRTRTSLRAFASWVCASLPSFFLFITLEPKVEFYKSQ